MIAATEKQTKRPRIRNNPTALARWKYILQHFYMNFFHLIATIIWTLTPWAARISWHVLLLGKNALGRVYGSWSSKQLTMCFLYLSTTIRINGATHVLKLKHLPWSRQRDFFHKCVCGIVQLPLTKKALDECKPCFHRPLCMYSTHTALSGSACISEALCMCVIYLKKQDKLCVSIQSK